MARRTEIVHEAARVRIGTSRNLFVAAWYDAPEVEDLRAGLRAGVALAGKRRGDAVHLHVALSGTPRFGDDVRAELVRSLRDPRVQAQATAFSVELAGLAGAATRAFLSTALLLSRTDTPHKVFGDRRAAAAWMVPALTKGGEAWSADDVLEVAAEVVKRAAPLVA
jgi:hypothetical protein